MEDSPSPGPDREEVERAVKERGWVECWTRDGGPQIFARPEGEDIGYCIVTDDHICIVDYPRPKAAEWATIAPEPPLRPSPPAECDRLRWEPENGVLHTVLPEHVETLLAHGQERDRPAPRFVERAYLECGLLCYGFVRLRCAACGHDLLIALSCKGRGFCPSCGGRRMADTAAHARDTRSGSSSSCPESTEFSQPTVRSAPPKVKKWARTSLEVGSQRSLRAQNTQNVLAPLGGQAVVEPADSLLHSDRSPPPPAIPNESPAEELWMPAWAGRSRGVNFRPLLGVRIRPLPTTRRWQSPRARESTVSPRPPIPRAHPWASSPILKTVECTPGPAAITGISHA